MSKKQDPALVEAIKNAYAGAGTTSIVADSSVFNSHLPDDLTEAQVQSTCNYVTKLTSASLEAAGQIAICSMKDDKKMDIVTAEVGMGAFGKATHVIHRSKEVTIPPSEKGGEATTQTQYGVVRTKVDFVAGRNSGLLGKARTAIKEEAAGLFGPKK
jgi:hypothetical protein